MKTTRILPRIAVSLGVTASLHAQTINFETLPDGSIPTARMAISNQFMQAFGVSFRLVDGNYPRIAKRDGTGFTAFLGPPDSTRSNHPANNQRVGNFFLTDDDGRAPSPADLVVTYAHPVAAASGVIIDIDYSDVWEIVARDSETNALATNILQTTSPNAGDGKATPWSFVRTNADIHSILVSYKGQGHNVGLAFDNFSPALPVAPATLGIALTQNVAQVEVSGTFGSTYRVDFTDLLPATNWQVLTNIVLTNEPQQSFLDTTVSNAPARYYRALGF